MKDIKALFWSYIKRALSLIIRNYVISAIIISLAFVGAVVAYKTLISKPTYMYAKIRVGQGLWWASTQKPSVWFVDAIRSAKEEKSITGKPVAKIISTVYYPFFGSGQYDMFVTLRLKVSKVGTAGKYNFQRSTLGIGAPIDLEFPSVQFSGTVIKLSASPIKEPYVEKTVTLNKKNAFPWEYDTIKVGDSYFNGETIAMRVIDKSASDTYSLTNDTYGNYPSVENELKKYIVIKVKLKGKMVNGQFVYAEDQVVIPGRNIGMVTPNVVFNDFTVAKVE